MEGTMDMTKLRRTTHRPVQIVSRGETKYALSNPHNVNNRKTKFCPDCAHELKWTRKISRFTCAHCLGAFTPHRLRKRTQENEASRLPESRVAMDAAIKYLTSQDVGGRNVVYYIRFRDALKIGTSTDVVNRVSHHPLEALLAIEPGSFKLEAHRHKQFAPYRIKGEWFEYNADTRAMVNTIRLESMAWFATAAQEMTGLPFADDGGLFPVLEVSPTSD